MRMNEYQNDASKTAIYPNRHGFMGLVYTALKLAGEAGEVSEKIGKIIRDSGSVVTEEKREMLAKECGDLLWYVAMCSDELGYTLEEVAKMNLNKLSDRKDRGVLSGSGDNR